MKSSLCYILCATAVYAETSQSASNAENFGGGYCGVGVSVGVKTTTADINSEFRNRSNSMSSAFYGGSANFGYQHRICGNCFVGIEMGVDFGSASKAKVGGVLKSDSYYIQNEYVKRELLRQMFHETANSLKTRLDPRTIGTYNNVISANVWSNFVNVLRFVGGANMNIQNNFVTDPADANPLFDPTTYNANANARLQNIIGNTYARISVYGNGDVFSGFQDLQEFVTNRYPICAAAFRNFAQQDLYDHIHALGTVAGTAAGGGTALPDALVFILHDFFSGSLLRTQLRSIGVNPANMGGATWNDLVAEINAILNPSAADDAALAVPAGVDVRTIQHNIQTKTSFGVCPYVAMKLGYYFREIRGCLFAKLGLIHLNGHVIPVNSVYGIQEEKFHKVAPFVAVELMKNINEKWGWAVEISHAFKAKKRLRDANFFGVRVENKTSISRTTVRLMATYRF